MAKTKVLLAQLGSPRSPKTGDVRHFLREFLGDPRVVDAPRWLWFIILNLFVLPFRPKRSARAYARIWDGDGFPLVKTTNDFAQALKAHVSPDVEVESAFLLAAPRVRDVLDSWEKEDPVTRAQHLLVLPQFPQYAESTTASVMDVVGNEVKNRVNLPTITILSDYHRAKCFIDNSVRLIKHTLQEQRPDVLIISFHGIPLRRVLQKKDLYFRHCLETFELIKRQLGGTSIPIKLSFQSRFGSEVWLGPATDSVAKESVAEGQKHVAVYCPSFVVDCLETTDEIGHELKEEVEALGGKLTAISCLNTDPHWVQDYAQFINVMARGSSVEKDEQYHQVDVKEQYMTALNDQAKSQAAPLSPYSKRVLKLMFITMFLDLVGFSIIFPMFPAIARHYLEWDADNIFLKSIFSLVGDIQRLGGEEALAGNAGSIVLFGGILGALYSLLQFIAAPIWGSISDKIGRKPVLVLSIAGLAASYACWMFAGSFTVLIIGRALGGLMSGNLSIASAIVADVTDQKNRSKGMAIIGIAFAFGFIFGPAIGGICTLYNPLRDNPALAFIGINPFSTAAVVAFVLCIVNLIGVLFFFTETLPKEKRGKKEGLHRTANIFKLFAPLPFKGTNITNWSYFLFITAFSGMEFTLTFLAVERFSYSSMDNAKMFIFIGLIIGLVQGGYVRRKAHTVGEKKMVLRGLALIIPGLLLIGYSGHWTALYGGLFFLAIGSAMVIPCITSMVSLFTPEDAQGRALGQFRGLGSLGRVIGPILASLSYWRFGAQTAYVVGALAILMPFSLIRTAPQVAAQE